VLSASQSTGSQRLPAVLAAIWTNSGDSAAAVAAPPCAADRARRRSRFHGGQRSLYIQLQIGGKTGRKNGSEGRFCGKAQEALVADGFGESDSVNQALSPFASLYSSLTRLLLSGFLVPDTFSFSKGAAAMI